jgi:hypothetical protein
MQRSKLLDVTLCPLLSVPDNGGHADVVFVDRERIQLGPKWT